MAHPGTDQDADDRLLDDIVDEFTRQLRAGESPSIEALQQQHPHLKESIAELLGSVAMIEQLKSSTVISDHDPYHREELFIAPQTIGEYDIVQQIGQGGMGVVFEAVHRTLGRRVAIKVLPSQMAESAARVERFRREALAAAKLHHTNIVGVFGVGFSEPWYYYVMDYIDGSGLDEVINQFSGHTSLESAETRCVDFPEGETPDSVASDLKLNEAQTGNQPKPSPVGKARYLWVAKIGASLADALAYAHSQGVLHRDIKPANFLLGQDGICRVTDFGLAKPTDSDVHLTKTGDLIGTPQYLAPESLEGKYDERSEAYCLGLTLYELLTLRPAFARGSTTELLNAIANFKPTPPRKIDPKIPVDLATVIEKSMSREPAQRYESAAALRDDLLAFAEGRPIAARRATSIDHLRRWSRTNPLAAVMSALSLLLLTLVAVSASIGYFATADALAKLQTQTDLLHEQQQATQQALSQSIESERKTAAQFQRAEANMSVSMEAFDEMFRQIITRGASSNEDINVDGFRELAGLETSITRQDVLFLEKLLGFYQDFAAINADNAQLASQSARAFRRVANINQLVGQSQDAIKAYREALRLFEWVYTADPEDTDAVLARVQTGNELASLLRKLNHVRESREEQAATLELIDSIPVEDLSDELKLELARTLNAVGINIALDEGMEPTTDSVPKSGKKIRQWLNQANRKGIRERREINDAISILEELLARSPDNFDYRSTLAACHCSLAAAQFPYDPRSARASRDLAVIALEELILDQPETAEYRFLLALACAIGDHSTKTDRRRLIDAVELASQLANDFPRIPDYHQLEANARVKLAVLQRESEELDPALQNVQQALLSMQHLRNLAPPNRTFVRSVMTLRQEARSLVTTLEADGRKEQAAQLRNDLRSVRSKLKPPR